jgi:hypothetical protein
MYMYIEIHDDVYAYVETFMYTYKQIYRLVGRVC